MFDLRPGRLPPGAFPDAPSDGRDLAFARRSGGLTGIYDTTAAGDNPGAGISGTGHIRSSTNPQPLAARD